MLAVPSLGAHHTSPCASPGPSLLGRDPGRDCRLCRGNWWCHRTPDGSQPPRSNKPLCLARGSMTLITFFLPELQSQRTCSGYAWDTELQHWPGQTMAYTEEGLSACSGFISFLSIYFPVPPSGMGDTSTMQLTHDRDIPTRTVRCFPWGHVQQATPGVTLRC